MKNFLIFITGAAIGAGGAYLFLKDKFEARTQEEIESVQKSFQKRLNEIEAQYDGVKKANEADSKEAANLSEKNGYVAEDKSSYDKEELNDFRQRHETNYAGTAADPIPKEEPADIYPTEEETREYPFVISPAIYDGGSNNEQSTLTYYKKSNCLVNEHGVELSIQDTIGEEALNHFGEFEPGIVYVRNNHLGYDYEVILDEVAEVM